MRVTGRFTISPYSVPPTPFSYVVNTTENGSLIGVTLAALCHVQITAFGLPAAGDQRAKTVFDDFPFKFSPNSKTSLNVDIGGSGPEYSSPGQRMLSESPIHIERCM